jgi:hypothetical protein
MSVLTLDVGGLDLPVGCQRGGHAAPDVIGSVRRSFSGVARSSVRAELMNVPVVLVHLDKDTARTIREMFAKGNQIVCNGEVFNNQLQDITVWGEITDEMIQGGTWWELSMVLHEVENADTVAQASNTTRISLNDTISDEDPGDETIRVANPANVSGGSCFRVLDDATPATCSSGSCPITFSSAPERTWLTPALAATTITGTPVAYFASKGINGLSGVDIQSTKAILYHVRAGVDLDSWETPYYAGFFAGGLMTMTFPDPLVLTIEDGDRLRLELWGRLALSPGSSDSQPYELARQTICYPGYLDVGGTVEAMP